MCGEYEKQRVRKVRQNIRIRNFISGVVTSLTYVSLPRGATIVDGMVLMCFDNLTKRCPVFISFHRAVVCVFVFFFLDKYQ